MVNAHGGGTGRGRRPIGGVTAKSPNIDRIVGEEIVLLPERRRRRLSRRLADAVPLADALPDSVRRTDLGHRH